jgi:hypothetical protein
MHSHTIMLSFYALKQSKIKFTQVKVKITLKQATKLQGESRGTALFFLYPRR